MSGAFAARGRRGRCLTAAQAPARKEGKRSSLISNALSRSELQGEELLTSFTPGSGQLHDAAAGEKLRWTLPASLPSAPSFGVHL